ncbi:DUF600 family protein [Macrococcoides canis]|uniref:immunity protein YezG family protein n=1 Tax=Macrococcoides canis TaxID=1855823 RepID=UPI0013E93154|nr:immunity protein YezG family protein [Macrococcus canis]QIH76466.1 DUF600 family protein [Macrococcus canis]
MEQEINTKIREIIHQANDMIPEEWDELYINGDINGDEGGIFFYYRISDEWIYSHDMFKKYENYSKSEFIENWNNLFFIGVNLQQIFRDYNQQIWSKMIIHVSKEMKLSTEFDYADWYNSDYVDYEYKDYFRVNYLGQSPIHIGMDVVQEIREFKNKENSQQR